MGYTILEDRMGDGRTIPYKNYKRGSLEEAVQRFFNESCAGLRYDEEKAQAEESGGLLGKSNKENEIPYNMQMDIDRLCLERAMERLLASGKKEDAFDVYFCYLEMFAGGYDRTSRMIELLSEYEAAGSNLLMKHRDHYVHSVYVFALGMAIYESNRFYREEFAKFYQVEEETKAAHLFLQYWGLASLFHDIGYPFELPFEQVSSYFEVEGNDRSKRPFVSYSGLEEFTKLDRAMQKKVADLYDLRKANKMITSTDELFAYSLSRKLSDTYYFSETGILDVLRNKPRKPDKFGYYMDHAYFSATVLFKRLFCEIQCELTKESVDALTAIILHNSLYKFSIAFYKEKDRNIPFKAELHPLAFMLMLCDELQCWDRTAYGRNSRRELHPMGCEFDFSGQQIKAKYIYDKRAEGKIRSFEEDYENWEKGGCQGERPKLKAYSCMYIRGGNEKSAFQSDIEQIVDLSQMQLTVTTELAENMETEQGRKGYLSNSNYINLYRFAVVLNGRWSVQKEWEDAVNKKRVDEFISDKERIKRFEESFRKLSLEYKLSNINQAKAFGHYLNEIDCFYTDREVDFEPLEKFDPKELSEIIGPMEHRRWLQEHYDMGWGFGWLEAALEGKEKEEKEQKMIAKVEEAYKDYGFKTSDYPWYKKNERETVRRHIDMIPVRVLKDQEISAEMAETNYKRLGMKEQDKDTEPMECMLALLKMYDGVRMYRLK